MTGVSERRRSTCNLKYDEYRNSFAVSCQMQHEGLIWPARICKFNMILQIPFGPDKRGASGNHMFVIRLNGYLIRYPFLDKNAKEDLSTI
ncbi:TPA: hypothetical protein HNC63_06830 [Escherichia fergusonii]|nr:hypothetical protein VL22_0213685 [Escherichia fergusonii]HAJ6529456.1 hypothetical protein [Escherichia fergusonii]HAJ6560665.1 hypothetical protein [Escherichia fergusonii]HAJ6568384.1 hypothetical protein [Escherichia fergusonii]